MEKGFYLWVIKHEHDIAQTEFKIYYVKAAMVFTSDEYDNTSNKKTRLYQHLRILPIMSIPFLSPMLSVPRHFAINNNHPFS